MEEGDEELLGEENVAVEEEAIASAEETPEDDGQALHDDMVVGSLRKIAIDTMKEQGVESTGEEQRMAWQLFPRVCEFQITLHIYVHLLTLSR